MAKTKQAGDVRRAGAARAQNREKAPGANSMGVIVADPAVKPREVSVAKIRSAVSAITRK